MTNRTNYTLHRHCEGFSPKQSTNETREFSLNPLTLHESAVRFIDSISGHLFFCLLDSRVLDTSLQATLFAQYDGFYFCLDCFAQI